MIKNDRWKIKFLNDGQNPADEHLFGCTVVGTTDDNKVEVADTDREIVWKDEQVGTAIFGSYDECMKDLTKLSRMTIPAAVLLFSTNESIAERFIRQIRKNFPKMPIAGGVTAGGENGELRPHARDLCALFIYDNTYLLFSEVLPTENEMPDENTDHEDLITDRLGTFASGKENSLIMIGESIKRGKLPIPSIGCKNRIESRICTAK